MEESQTNIFTGLARCWLGFAHSILKEHRLALDFAQKGLKIHSDLSLSVCLSWCHWCCSIANFDLSNLEEAQIHAEKALQCSLTNNEKLVLGISRTLLGRVLAKIDPGQIDVAEGQILQGISELEELGMLSFLSIGYLWLGEVYTESGRKEDALTNLKKAETLFREMGMNYWLAKAQEKLSKFIED